MIADKNEALNMLEENLGEEIARKEEEFEVDWKNFAKVQLEEQEQKLKSEWSEREERQLREIREARASTPPPPPPPPPRNSPR